jgi:hypothetical protein
VERTQLSDLMGERKLCGMKAAFDEIMAMATASSTNPTHCRRPAQYRDQREAGSFDQVPSHQLRLAGDLEIEGTHIKPAAGK